MNINAILNEAPAKISRYTEQEINEYKKMIGFHEFYKRERARKYLEAKVKEDITIKDLEYRLDCDPDLMKIKDDEQLAEIAYRGFRRKKEYARDMLQIAFETGWNKRVEMRSLNDTVKM